MQNACRPTTRLTTSIPPLFSALPHTHFSCTRAAAMMRPPSIESFMANSICNHSTFLAPTMRPPLSQQNSIVSSDAQHTSCRRSFYTSGDACDATLAPALGTVRDILSFHSGRVVEGLHTSLELTLRWRYSASKVVYIWQENDRLLNILDETDVVVLPRLNPSSTPQAYT